MAQAYQSRLALKDAWPKPRESRLDGRDMNMFMVLSKPKIKFAKVDQNSK
jgi:hypothetical protein